MFTGTRPSAPEVNKRSCAFCLGNHYSTECTIAPTVEERFTIAKVKRLCFNCLSSNHSSSADCPSKKRYRTCKRSHHTSLHYASRNQQDHNTPVHSQTNSNNVSTQAAVTNASVSKTVSFELTKDSATTFVFLETAIVTVHFKGIKRQANVLIDKGAQRSFITTKLARNLHLQPLYRESLLIVGFAASTQSAQLCDVSQLSFIDRRESMMNNQVVVVDHIVNPLEDSYRSVVCKLPHLKNLPLAHPNIGSSSFDIDILLGANYYWDIVGDHIVRGPGPTAISSRFGYIISGCMQPTSEWTQHDTAAFHVSVEEQFEMARFWDLESLGISPESEIEDATMAYRTNCIELRNGRYIARLPWKNQHPPLGTNWHMCRQQTRHMIRRLAKNTSHFQAYNRVIQEQLNSGFI
ncbi:uncharacterized protein LOC130701904 [Daphnia carinata]|uniref:uncharacterized protein LOC130701904 n=1 Tax=Daphnia carinata TaxID=120202 RepID=UPI00257E169E|nr:uncharacterized protein LOC130701904 [Daphnia carinata]